MTKCMMGRAAAVFVFVLAGVLGTDRAQAQADAVYLQLEAHMTEALATEMVAAYTDDFDNVVGYRLQASGWHVIALGPFDSRDAANDLRRQLQAARRIPPDAFVNTASAYGDRFWPPAAPEVDEAALAAARLAEEAAALAAEAQRLAAEMERLEAERLAAAEAARQAAEQVAQVEAQRRAAEAEAARLEAERTAAAEEATRLEAERLAEEEALRLEAERLAAEEEARLAAEAARLAAEEEAARIEAERLAAEEAARLEAERLAAEEAARLEAERLAAEEAARLAEEAAARIEAERLAAEEAARLEAERLAAEAAREESLPEARRSEAQLDRDERAEIQIALQWKGYYTLAIDAAFGPGTRRAMEAWQADRGLDPTGVLTTRQRTRLLEEYRSEKAAIGLTNWRDDTSGIAVDLPLGMVEFARYEAPFVHFDEIGDSGLRVLLISQPGNLATLFGLYEIMQTLEIVPLDGPRERRRNAFLLTGQNEMLRSHTFAQHASGQIKGYTLIWTPDNDAIMERVLPAVEASFATFGGTLPEGTGLAASSVTGGELLAGLEIRRPSAARTGFYVDSTGSVLTSADLVAACGRITIDETHEARVAFIDPELGFAVLRPAQPLAPLAFANFHLTDPAPRSEVRVAGFSFEDLLTRPTLAIGQLAALQGLNGEADLRRLTVPAMPGDAGGPVFDATGSVIGMLLPAPSGGARLLPEDVHLAVAGATLHNRLQAQGIRPANLTRAAPMPDEELMRAAADMTVLVSCWN